MQYFSGKFATINYIEGDRLVEVIWKETSPNSADYRLTLTKALVCAKIYGAENWISDLEVMETVSVSDSQWVLDHLLSNIVSVGVKRVAFLLNSKVYPDYHRPEFDAAVKKYKIHFATFFNKESAISWLRTIKL